MSQDADQCGFTEDGMLVELLEEAGYSIFFHVLKAVNQERL